MYYQAILRNSTGRWERVGDVLISPQQVLDALRATPGLWVLEGATVAEVTSKADAVLRGVDLTAYTPAGAVAMAETRLGVAPEQLPGPGGDSNKPFHRWALFAKDEVRALVAMQRKWHTHAQQRMKEISGEE